MAELRFSFGRNWINYAKNAVDVSVMEEARHSLLRFLPQKEFADKVFVDAGCGSGIFSLAALKLGAAKAVSFDYDPQSLEASDYIRAKFAGELAPRWEIFRGDILSPEFIASGKARGDIVYSWGVLHHTGNMNAALENALSLVNPGGWLAIALYNKTPASQFWEKTKRFYNAHPLSRPFMELGWGTAACAAYAVRRCKLNLRRERGMNVFYDAVDWIGGYPYEYAYFDEIKSFMEQRGAKLSKEVTRLPAKSGGNIFNKVSPFNTGCNELLFKK